MQPMTGNGRFQWNTGGWFGAQLGGSCWILPLAIAMFVRKAPDVGWIMLGLFLAANAAGAAIWLQRGRRRPYQAIQLLLAVLFLASLGSLAALHLTGAYLMLEPGSTFSPAWYLMTGMFPGLMLMFHLIERGGRQDREGGRD